MALNRITFAHRKKAHKEEVKEGVQTKNPKKGKISKRTKKWIKDKTKNVPVPGNINVKKKVKQWEQNDTKSVEN